MTSGEALGAVTGRGICVSVEGDRLFVDPVSAVTDDERAALKAEKKAVVAFLRLLSTATTDDEPTAAKIVDEIERAGAGLWIRPNFGLVILHGERISDELLIRLVRAHDRVECAIRARYAPESGLLSAIAPEPEMSDSPVAESDDGLSLLDYAGRVLGWHQDWPEARASAFPTKSHAYYTLGGKAHRYEYDETVALPTPTPADELRATPVPAKVERWAKKREQNLNVCGECRKRFTATTAQASADMLRQHVESDPCEQYATATPAQLVARAWQEEYRKEADRRKAEGYAASADAEHVKRTNIPGLLSHEQFRRRTGAEMETDRRAEQRAA
jgi:hypothetical protein